MEKDRLMFKDASEPSWKYDEDRYLEEIRDYLASTYGQHYVGSNNVQAIDLIKATGRLEDFSIGSILKYGARFGKKNGKNRKDLLKVIHYAVFALHELDRQRAEELVVAGPRPVSEQVISGEFPPTVSHGTVRAVLPVDNVVTF